MPESILVLTHAGEASHSLSKASLETVTAGKELSARLNAPMTIGIISANYADTARSLAGVNTRVLGVAGEPFVEARYATDAAACEALCRAANPTIILAPQSSRMARVAAALAHRLSGCIDTHVTSVRGEDSRSISRRLAYLSSTSRSRRANTSGRNGFWRNAAPGSRAPWCTIASSVYPDM